MTAIVGDSGDYCGAHTLRNVLVEPEERASHTNSTELSGSDSSGIRDPYSGLALSMPMSTPS